MDYIEKKTFINPSGEICKKIIVPRINSSGYKCSLFY